MFGFISDLAKGIGEVVGTVTGIIVGVPLAVIAETLNITIDMVKEAKDAGCETYEEIRKYHNLK
ncbi:hypothetical protein [Joostella sp.]|uniref:hypothetical protein n=1 Tax=Joostella sp. TaxID=2231138 RepID=UPI003A8CA2E3